MFSVSNIAWLPEEEESALDMLTSCGIRQLEVAPGRLWPAGGETPLEEVPRGMEAIVRRGFSISGFQAILFGKPELQLFDEVTRPGLMRYLQGLAGVCASAGGSYLVFGAPKNRWVPEGMDRCVAFPAAIDFFRELGAHAQKLGVVFGIEANPGAYSCNFCTHVEDVVRLVKAVDSPGVRWHADTGELAMNAESVPDVILDHIHLAGSLHVSEPQLADFSSPWSGHAAVSSALRAAGYQGPVSLEMKRPASGVPGVEQAVRWMLETYS